MATIPVHAGNQQRIHMKGRIAHPTKLQNSTVVHGTQPVSPKPNTPKAARGACHRSRRRRRRRIGREEKQDIHNTLAHHSSTPQRKSFHAKVSKISPKPSRSAERTNERTQIRSFLTCCVCLHYASDHMEILRRGCGQSNHMDAIGATIQPITSSTLKKAVAVAVAVAVLPLLLLL